MAVLSAAKIKADKNISRDEKRESVSLKAKSIETDYHALNAMLNLYDMDGNIQFEKDVEAARQFFLQHVNQNTVFFHDLDEKLDYLIENDYYEREVLEQYSRKFLHEIYEYCQSNGKPRFC